MTTGFREYKVIKKINVTFNNRRYKTNFEKTKRTMR